MFLLQIFACVRSSHQRCSIKKVFLEISQNSQINTCARVSFLIKLQAKDRTLLDNCFCCVKGNICKRSKLFTCVLKEIRSYNRKLFLCPAQKQAKTQSTFQHVSYTFSHQTKYLYRQKAKFILPKSYLNLFYSVWKETTHKTLKQQMQKAFALVRMLLVQLASMNIFYSM